MRKENCAGKGSLRRETKGMVPEKERTKPVDNDETVLLNPEVQLSCIKREKKKFISTARVCIECLQRHKLTAVSYTHLDVYKRQLYMRIKLAVYLVVCESDIASALLY